MVQAIRLGLHFVVTNSYLFAVYSFICCFLLVNDASSGYQRLPRHREIRPGNSYDTCNDCDDANNRRRKFTIMMSFDLHLIYII